MTRCGVAQDMRADLLIGDAIRLMHHLRLKSATLLPEGTLVEYTRAIKH